MKQFQTKFISVDSHLCHACWECFNTCPKQVFGKINILGIHKHVYVKFPDVCIGCKKCIKVCQHGAIIFKKEEEVKA